ncbi:MAG: HAD-IC family P-type ATPase [Cyanobacteria bacterium SBLK]|nr:HAD-IC family P-type ATPase [Cyanobacteria bacterium SBLK]
MSIHTGLSEAEAIALRKAGRGNNISLTTSRSYLQILQENLFTFINTVFFTLSIFLIFLGRVGDALLVGVVILGGVIVNVLQEVWAKRKLDRIALLTRPRATVIREGKERNIDPKEIVLGDILVLETGDQIVVDGKIIGEANVEVDESLLTGESDAIAKEKGDIVYSGSICTSGRTYYRVTQVGKASFAYQITAKAREFRKIYTPLQLEINLVIRIFLLLATFLWILVGVSVWTGFLTFRDGVQRAAVIAGLVPSGLYLSITLAYALGAVRMVGQEVLIQQANAVESLSNVDVLCLDKTGTLTTNRIHLNALHPIDRSEKELAEILGDYVFNSTTQNKTSEAIAEVYPGTKQPVTWEISFSSTRKWSAIAFANELRAGTYLFGAPEMLSDRIALNEANRETINTLTKQGLRVLLLIHHPDIFPKETISNLLVSPSGLPKFTPLGIISFSDELRHDAKETLTGFANAGIHLKIISGDNPDTVAALAIQVGLGEEIPIISGVELAKMDDSEFARAAKEYKIFGRITPEQKAKLVESLRQDDRYVAAMGDGVNDVLALKKANLGIAMESGSKATRNAADIVLLKDSFASLPHTFLEGQRIRNGIQDVLKLFMVRVFVVTLIIFATGQVLGTFPMLNKHSAVVTIIAVGLPTGFIPIWAKTGQFPQGSIVRSLLHFTLPATLSMTLTGLGVYLGYLVKSLWEATDSEVMTSLALGLSGSSSLSLCNAIVSLQGALLSDRLLAIPRSALVTILVWCGLLLVPFLKPPTTAWVGGEPLSRDWRYTGVAIALIGLYCCLLAIPVTRHFFELSLLSWLDYCLLGLIALGWCLSLRYLWRQKLLDRFLGVKLK